MWTSSAKIPPPVVPLRPLPLPFWGWGKLLNFAWWCPAGPHLVKLGNFLLARPSPPPAPLQKLHVIRIKRKSKECLLPLGSCAERDPKQQHPIQAAPSVHGVMPVLDIHTTSVSLRITSLASPSPRKGSRNKQRRLPF